MSASPHIWRRGWTSIAGTGGSAYCRKYGIKTLVFAEQHDTIQLAIAREKALKVWKREWKIVLIEGLNPDWNDLYDVLA